MGAIIICGHNFLYLQFNPTAPIRQGTTKHVSFMYCSVVSLAYNSEVDNLMVLQRLVVAIHFSYMSCITTTKGVLVCQVTSLDYE
jgi:hypothetical protein